MVKNRMLIIIGMIILFHSSIALAQITQPKLNHAELMKQFLGNWQTELGKDTLGTLICKSFYNGFDFYFKIESKEKIIFEEKTLTGYDEKYDKLIKLWVQSEKPEFGLVAVWFSSPKVCEEVLFEDISYPDKAKNKWIFEFKSPDLLTLKDVVDNKVTNTYTFHREK
jgi:hypothetical protein